MRKAHYNETDKQVVEIIKTASCKAYRIFLKTSSIFLSDLNGYGITEKDMLSKIRTGIENVRKDFIKQDSEARTLLYNILDEVQDITDYKYFVLDLFNLLIIATHLKMKNTPKSQLEKNIEKSRFVDNIALMIIEGSHIGRSDSNFMPYFSRKDPIKKKDKAYKSCHANMSNKSINQHIYYDDFYFAQNAYLQHLLLMLVKLYQQWDVLPSLSHSKISQKHIINNAYVKRVKNSAVPSDVLNDTEWSSSLINIIVHFEEIMNQFKTKLKRSHNFILANIRFTEDFILCFNYKELIKHYNIDEERTDLNLVSMTAIRETIALIMEQELKLTRNKDRVWKDVEVYMNSFGLPVQSRKNTNIDLDNGVLINIKNKASKEFSISISKRDVDMTLPISTSLSDFTRTARIKSFGKSEFEHNTRKIQLFEESYCFSN